MRAEPIELKEKFSKGLAAVKSDNQVPIQYATEIWNIRIQDKGITPRNGFVEVYKGSVGVSNGIWGIDSYDRIISVVDEKLNIVNYTAGTVEEVGDVVDGKCRFLNFDKYTLIFTGTTKPYVLNNDTKTLTLLTTTVPDSVFPSFGEKYNKYTFIAHKNKLYSSKGIVSGSETNCYDFTASTTSFNIVYDTNILALKSTQERMRVFTESNIEYIDKSTITTVGDQVTVFSEKFAGGEKILNPDVVVAVGSKLFWINKGMKIRAIGYYEGVAQLQVGDVSDIPLVGIDNFMQTYLHSDQSKAFGVFDSKRNLIKWYLRSKDSLVNDVVVCYDLVNKTFLLDDGKRFSGEVDMNGRLFAQTAHKSNQIFEDEIGKSDDGESYRCRYKTTNIKLGQPNKLKFFRGGEFAGKVNDLTKITMGSFIDGKSVMKPLVVYQGKGTIDDVGIAGVPIAGIPIGENITTYDSMKPRSKVITASHVRGKGKGNMWEMIFEGKGQDWIFDYMKLFAIPMGKFKLSDKF